MICPGCGQELPNTAKMCYTCKTKFEQNQLVKEDERNKPSFGVKVLCILGVLIGIALIIFGTWLASSVNQNPFSYIFP